MNRQGCCAGNAGKITATLLWPSWYKIGSIPVKVKNDESSFEHALHNTELGRTPVLLVGMIKYDVVAEKVDAVYLGSGMVANVIQRVNPVM